MQNQLGKWLGMGLMAAAMIGCAQTRLQNSVNTEYDPADTTASLNFWHELALREAVSNNEAMHALVRLAGGDDPADSYLQRRQWLIDQGLLADDFNEPADAPATRGMVAQVLCNILDIDGGLTMRLIGPHPRYATRELVFLDIYEPSSPQQGFSGIQFVEVINEAEDFQENRS
jgi:hypothetical protein